MTYYAFNSFVLNSYYIITKTNKKQNIKIHNMHAFNNYDNMNSYKQNLLVSTLFYRYTMMNNSFIIIPINNKGIFRNKKGCITNSQATYIKDL